jgi:hypothetical protein
VCPTAAETNQRRSVQLSGRAGEKEEKSMIKPSKSVIEGYPLRHASTGNQCDLP